MRRPRAALLRRRRSRRARERSGCRLSRASDNRRVRRARARRADPELIAAIRRAQGQGPRGDASGAVRNAGRSRRIARRPGRGLPVRRRLSLRDHRRPATGGGRDGACRRRREPRHLHDYDLGRRLLLGAARAEPDQQPRRMQHVRRRARSGGLALPGRRSRCVTASKRTPEGDLEVSLLRAGLGSGSPLRRGLGGQRLEPHRRRRVALLPATARAPRTAVVAADAGPAPRSIASVHVPDRRSEDHEGDDHRRRRRRCSWPPAAAAEAKAEAPASPRRPAPSRRSRCASAPTTSPAGRPPTRSRSSARRAAKLSGGAIRIEPVWHAAGDGPDWDQRVARMVTSGELDMGVIPRPAAGTPRA